MLTTDNPDQLRSDVIQVAANRLQDLSAPLGDICDRLDQRL